MKKSRLALVIWLVLALGYVLLTYYLQIKNPSIAKYHLSNSELRWVNVSIIAPIVLIMFLAYIGFSNLRRYYKSIAASPDGRAYRNIGFGIGFFAYGTLAISCISTFFKWLAQRHTGLMMDTVRINNYLSLALPLISFWLIGDGVNRLTIISRIRYRDLHIRTIIAVTALLGASYAFVTFHQDASVINKVIAGPNNYYLPAWLVMISLVLPYAFAWAIGMLSVAQVLVLRRKVRGLVYRNALRLLAIGIGLVLFSYIVVEYITSLSNKLLGLKVGWILLIVYCFLIFLGIGYLCIAIGSRRLKRIEEV